MGSPVSLTSDLKSSEEHVFIQVSGGNNSWINFWDFSYFSQHVFPFVIYRINELVKGTNSLTHRCFPHLRRREILASLDHSSFRKKDTTKRRDHHGGCIPETPSPGAAPGTEPRCQTPPGEGPFPAPAEALGCGKPSGITIPRDASGPNPPKVGGLLAIGHGALVKVA